MTNSIDELSAKIEELDKRLKAINLSQNVMGQLITIRDYFSDVQKYLKELNTAFNEHILTSEDYNNKINDLQTQIDEINEKLDSIPSLEDYDISTMSEDIAQLKKDTSTLSENLSSLMQDHASTISDIENSLSTITTNLSQVVEKQEEYSSQISQNTSNIDSLTAKTADLQTAQTNLTATQTSITNTVSNLSTRLTSAEKEITALNGGVDLTELDERIHKIEPSSIFKNPLFYKKININLTPINHILTTKEYYYYKTGDNPYLYHKIKFLYTTSSSGTLTFDIVINKESYKQSTINLSEYQSEYEIEFMYIAAKTRHQNIKFCFSSSDTIQFNSIELMVIGTGVNCYDFDQDVKVYGFGDYTYITKKTENTIYYDKFTKNQTIDLNNLTKSFELMQENTTYTHFLFIPYIAYDSSLKLFSEYVDGKIFHMSNGVINIDQESPNLSSNSNLCTRQHQDITFSDYVFGYYTTPYCMYIHPTKQTPACYDTFTYNVSYSFDNLENIISGKWLYATAIQNNYRNLSSTPKQFSTLRCIALNEDGYFYILPQKNISYVTQIGHGFTATAYEQEDNSINVYINNINYIDKYTLTLDANNRYISSFIERIEDCCYIYETQNGSIIKLVYSTEEWIVENNIVE